MIINNNENMLESSSKHKIEKSIILTHYFEDMEGIDEMKLIKSEKRSQITFHPEGSTIYGQSARRTFVALHLLFTTPAKKMTVVTLGNLGGS